MTENERLRALLEESEATLRAAALLLALPPTAGIPRLAARIGETLAMPPEPVVDRPARIDREHETPEECTDEDRLRMLGFHFSIEQELPMLAAACRAGADAILELERVREDAAITSRMYAAANKTLRRWAAERREARLEADAENQVDEG